MDKGSIRPHHFLWYNNQVGVFMDKKEYIFGGIEEVNFDFKEQDTEANLLLEVYAIIPAT